MCLQVLGHIEYLYKMCLSLVCPVLMSLEHAFMQHETQKGKFNWFLSYTNLFKNMHNLRTSHMHIIRFDQAPHSFHLNFSLECPGKMCSLVR